MCCTGVRGDSERGTLFIRKLMRNPSLTFAFVKLILVFIVEINSFSSAFICNIVHLITVKTFKI